MEDRRQPKPAETRTPKRPPTDRPLITTAPGTLHVPPRMRRAGNGWAASPPAEAGRNPRLLADPHRNMAAMCGEIIPPPPGASAGPPGGGVSAALAVRGARAAASLPVRPALSGGNATQMDPHPSG